MDLVCRRQVPLLNGEGQIPFLPGDWPFCGQSCGSRLQQIVCPGLCLVVGREGDGKARNGNPGPAGTGRADDAPPQGIKPHRFSVFLSGLPRDSVRRPFLHPHNAPTLPEADTSSFPPLKNDVQGSLRLKRFTGRPRHPTLRTNPFPPRRNSRNRIRKKPSSFCGRRASSLQPSYPCADRPFRLCREQHTPTFREGRLFQAAPSA